MAEDYIQFMSRIKHKLNIDLTLYKEAQMKRRLTSLRDKRGFRNFDLYFKALDTDDALLSEFVDRITINVSSFFRNSNRWDVLQNSILPALIEHKSSIKIWSAACSTGEEPYSMAMMLKTHFPDVKATIIATDIDDNILNRARSGIYQSQSLVDVPTTLQQAYFEERSGRYYIHEDLKRMITFKKHDLLKDPYPDHTDLIICRNVLIYFTDQAKERIYTNISESLNPNGVLFVGSTEQIFSPDKYDLQLLDTFFYQKSTD
ncbi:CheR family methyltransferase [Lentibacillus saliphilus]|uniref:CheR family methyltransferase n=1 Tax=Lentibacillus saliphilus TaxID=2737028 RepID=UPI001C30662C